MKIIFCPNIRNPDDAFLCLQVSKDTVEGFPVDGSELVQFHSAVEASQGSDVPDTSAQPIFQCMPLSPEEYQRKFTNFAQATEVNLVILAHCMQWRRGVNNKS